MNYVLVKNKKQNWSYVPACASGVGKRAAVSQNTGCVAALHNHHHLGQQRNFLVSKNCTIISPPPTAMLYLQHGITFTGTIPPWISPPGGHSHVTHYTQVTTNPAQHLISLETPVLVVLVALNILSSSTNFMIFFIFSIFVSHFPISRKH